VVIVKLFFWAVEWFGRLAGEPFYTTGLACENRPAAHTIAYDDDKNKEYRASMSEPFRFLSLPKEIRLRIYHYLAPNTPISPFRDDGGPCCPSILRTNRIIYEEAVVE
jgi:hypothetical protein